MRRKRYNPIKPMHEFELDLAPLLAVMVKLVPVLIASSAFVQVMIVESDLPQAVKEQIQQEKDDKNDLPQLSLLLTKDQLLFTLSHKGNTEEKRIAGRDGVFDLKTVHQMFVEAKTKYPSTFKLDFKPSPDFPYAEMMKIMDEARRAKKDGLNFEFKNPSTGEISKTNYMFPEIVFANVLEG